MGEPQGVDDGPGGAVGLFCGCGWRADGGNGLYPGEPAVGHALGGHGTGVARAVAGPGATAAFQPGDGALAGRLDVAGRHRALTATSAATPRTISAMPAI